MSTPRKRPEDKIKAGRPTKYLPKYCKTAIAMGRRGETIVHLANSLGVSKDTINEWTRVWPEFSDAMKQNKCLSEQWWIKHAMERAEGTGTGSDRMIAFMLSAAYGYREKTDVKSETQTQVTLVGSAADIIKQAVANVTATTDPVNN